MTLKTRGNAGCVPHILGILPFRCVLCRMTHGLEVYPTLTHCKVQEILHENVVTSNSQFGLGPATIYKCLFLNLVEKIQYISILPTCTW